VAGLTEEVDPPINDVWTVPGEEHLLSSWQEEDRQLASDIDTMTYYHKLQIEDFVNAVKEDRDPVVTGEEARKAVELFTAIYRSQRDNLAIHFPLKPEADKNDFDGRLSYLPFSKRERVDQ
jgi:predicted dehydrogenase